MTAEKFHDALTQLPMDLVAEADQIRRNPGKKLQIQKFLAVAACFALVLGSYAILVTMPCGGSGAPKSASTMESAAEAPAQASLREEQFRADTAAGAMLGVTYLEIPVELAVPTVHFAESWEQMQEILGNSGREESWFDSHDVIVIFTYGDVVVAGMEKTDGIWEIFLEDGRAGNCILIDVEKGLISDVLELRLNFG